MKFFFGGLIYDSKKPKKTEMLRWIYGKKREAIELKNRKLNPYETTLTSNLLIKKKILENHPFHADIKNYGYEDLVFINELKKNKIQIKHTENPTYHLNLEESSIFLDKIQTSLNNLKLLIDKKIIQSHETKFSSMYSKLSRYKLTLLVELQFNILKSVYTKNLMSKKPSLLVYDLYRIGYYCMINSKK